VTTDAAQTNNGPTESQANATTDQAANATPAAQVAQPDAAEASTTPARVAPESYEFKAAEGRELDSDVTSAFTEVARELNMPQDEAQKVIDKMAPVLEARTAKMLEAATAEWGNAAKTDKEFGGDKFDESLATAKSFLTEFGTPEITQLLNQSGLGNHPEVIRLFYRAGKALGPDRVITGQASTGAGNSIAQRMYPGMNP
jgi:hypothetical protein